MVQVNSFLDREHAGNSSVMHSQGSGSDCPGTPLGVSHIHAHHADLTLRPGKDGTSQYPGMPLCGHTQPSCHVPSDPCHSYADLHSQISWLETGNVGLELAVLLSTMPLTTSPNATSPWFGESDSGWPQTNVPSASTSPVLGLQAGTTFDLTFVP